MALHASASNHILTTDDLPCEDKAPSLGDPGAADVWEQWKETSLARTAVLEEAVTALMVGTLDRDIRRRAKRESHKLAGSVGMFGFARGAQLAREIEEILRSGERLTSSHALTLSQLVVALRDELERPVTAEHSTQDGVGRQRRVQDRPLLLVIEPDRGLADRIALEAAVRGVRVATAPNLDAAYDSVDAERPHVVVLSALVADQARANELLVDLTAGVPPVPVLVLAEDDTLTERMEMASRGASGFLPKSLPAETVVEAVTDTLRGRRTAQRKVLAVSERPPSLSSLRPLLEPYGIEMTMLTDPWQFWDTLEETMPDLVILDFEMVEVSGIDLCRVVRHDQRWRNTPILFLVPEINFDIVHRVFAAHADDFVRMPVVGPELVARVVNRLERAELYRHMAETDVLTGVTNRRRAGQVLSQYLRTAGRHDQPLSLAVVRVDGFKEINDRYGYAAADDMLQRLGELLLETFRDQDVVGRWGGAEFVVGMYGMPQELAETRLTELHTAFTAEVFSSVAGDTFHATFSAAVAQFPDHGKAMQALYHRADDTLRLVKAAGGNRVVQAEWRPSESEITTETVDVVVVESDDVLAKLLMHAVETRGYRATWIADGQEAIDRLCGDSALHARVVLLAVNLPGADGFTVLRDLTAARLTGTRVIMVTDRSTEAEILKALELGAHDHVAKPFSLPILLHRIRQAMVA